MSDLLRTVIGFCIFVFVLSYFADPADLAHDIGSTTGKVVGEFYEGFTEG